MSDFSKSNKFVIFAHPRSGSTSLARVLDESVDVEMSLEPFHPKYKEWNPSERNYSKFIIDTKTLDIALDEIFSKYNAIKVLNYQFTEEIYFHLLSNKDLKMVFLTRKNLFDAAISNAVATQVGKWHKDEKANYDNLKSIDPQVIGNWMEYVGDLNKTYLKYLEDNRDGDFIHVLYEDLYSEDFAKSKLVLEKVCKFVSIAMPSDEAMNKFMIPKNAKINSDDIYKKIPNYIDLVAEFADNEIKTTYARIAHVNKSQTKRST